jgi:class 3 adenylate cyclase/tetratricopeptide (TPR) repeat protein
VKAVRAFIGSSYRTVGGPGIFRTLSPVRICTSCGRENASDAKFCSECGTPLTEAPPPGRTERKVVTVLFADLVGFTARAERLDPEDVQAVLSPYHARLRSELERFGGTVEKFIGDAVMALFGAPLAHEDDPERAVRAALAIRDWIAEEGTLQVRIAVNTGEALINLGARPDAGEGMAAGDIVNSAARMQSAAPVNGILVGESTRRATEQSIDYRDADPVEAKGKEAPIPVWEAVQARARFGVDLAQPARGPLVGRERELGQLVAALERAEGNRAPELVTLVGVPGIGKSRLVGELFAWVEQSGQLTYWRQGRSLPYGEGVSFWALAEMVKAQAGILETDTEADVETRLARTVGDLIDDDAEWVLGHLRPLVGQAGDTPGSQEEAFAAWRRFFESMAERRPLVLVFEDVQWADDGLLDFVEHLADWVRDVPMLVLCTARLELLERRPAWGGGKVNAATVALAPLSDTETARLISSLSEQPLLEAETQTALLERAGGNPLYAEQYVRMLAERGTADGLPLPESVQGIIAARLDALPPAEKALLQDAAVVGKVFWLGALGASERQLHALQQKEFVQRARRSSVEGETEFAFKHLLVRDVAYGQIPRAERARKHVRTAEWIESLGRREDHAEMVAHHYVSALELAGAAGEDTGSIEGRARRALREAGDRASSLSALEQAQHYYAEALAIATADDRGRLDLLYLLGRIRYLRANEGVEELEEARDGFLAAGDRGGAAEAELLLADLAWHDGVAERVAQHLDAAQTLVAGTPPSRVHANVLSNASRYAMLADRNEPAVELGRAALRMAEELGLDDIRAHALNTVGAARVFLGDAAGVDDLLESIELATRMSSIPDVIRGYNNIGTVTMLLGRCREAAEATAESIRIAEHYGHHGVALWGSGGPTIGPHYQQGRWDEAVDTANAFLAKAGDQHYQSGSAYAFRGLVRVGRGDDAGAAEDADRAVDLARRVGDPQAHLPVIAMGGVIFWSTGEAVRAEELLDELLRELDRLPQIGFAGIELHGVAWVARQFSREAEVEARAARESFQSPWVRAGRAVAAGDMDGAVAIFAEVGAPAQEAFYRLQAAERLVAEGRRAEADRHLRPALAFYRAVGAARFVREGETLLAATA